MRLRLTLAAGLLALPAALASPAAAATPLDAVDHFTCAKAAEQPPIAPGIPVVVGLKDQFGAANLKVGPVIAVCDPVRKIHDGNDFPVKNPELHLVCFRLQQPNQKLVEVHNQFGLRRLDVGPARRLCVPSYKEPLTPGLPPLNLLDHYKCYSVRPHQPAPGGLPAQVQLEQQGHLVPGRVGQPILLCNPVKKRHGDVVTDVRYPDLHLVCFRLAVPPQPPTTAWTWNQFGRRLVKQAQPQELCVPSYKRELPTAAA